MKKLALIGVILFLTLLKPSFAQTIVDSFNDFPNNPAWTGDINNFQAVTPHTSGDGSLNAITDGTVLGSKPSTPSSAIFTQTNRAYGQWSFSATDGRNWSVSSTNDFFIVLLSDTNDPNAYKGTLNFNGYYLRFDGSVTDKFVLYRQQGTIKTVVINTGYPNNEDGTASIPRSFRILRTTQGEWSIYIDEVWDKTARILRGTAVDNTITTGQYFGIVTNISSPSAARVIWFDNLYCGDIIYDTTPPEVVSAEAISSNQIEVTFNEPVNTTAIVPTNYQLQNFGNPATVDFTNTTNTTVILSFNDTFSHGITLTLTISNIADEYGNTIPQPIHLPILWAPPMPGDIVINEIFFDPTPSYGLPDYDFLELYNRRNYPIKISEWKLQIGTKTITFPTFTMQPDSYLIIAPSAAATSYSQYGTVLTLISTTDLPTTGREIILRDNNNQQIHYVSYNLSYYNDPNKEEGGYSIELIDPESWCQQKSNWRASIATIGGTPGAINSVRASNPDSIPPRVISVWVENHQKIGIRFSEEIPQSSATDLGNYIVINGPEILNVDYDNSTKTLIYLNLVSPILEGVHYPLFIHDVSDYCGNIMNPTQFSIVYKTPQPGDIVINEIFFDPTPSYGLPDYDFLELYNRKNYPINITSWKLQIGTKNITFPVYVMEPNSYLLLTPSSASADYAQYGPVLALISTTDLPTTGREIVLRDQNEQQMHRVSYNLSYYQDPSKEEGGYSIELIDPESWCQQKSNWRASIAPIGGTPGAVNSVRASNPDTVAPNVLSVWAETGRKIGILFSEQIPSAIASNPLNYQLSVPYSITSLEFDTVEKNLVFLILNQAIPLNGTAEITIKNISDFCGNLMTDVNKEFAYVIPSLGSVVFNEIMCNPKVGTPYPTPYIELFNPNPYPINLNGWKLRSGSTTYTFPPIAIDSLGYLIIRPTNSPPVLNNQIPEIGLFSSTFLSKTGKTLALYSSQDILIHTITYSDTWYKDEFKKLGGWSLEQIDWQNICAGGNNWRASNDPLGGTPGRRNSIEGANPDTTSPKIMYVTVDDDSSVTLHFNEALHAELIRDITQWQIIPGGIPLDIQPNFPNSDKIKVALREPLIENQEYTIIPPTIFDCVGNSTTIQPAKFHKPTAPLAGDLVINELLFYPLTGSNEFIELYNKSNKILTINRMYITRELNGNLDEPKIVSPHGHMIYPGQYLVLAKSRKKVFDFYPNVDSLKIVEITTMPSLPSSEGNVILLDLNGVGIDQFYYTSKMHSPLLRNVKGVSLERINVNVASDDPSNWQSAAKSVGYATPGYRNSQALDYQINQSEFSLSTPIFSPDGDGFHDFLIINYQFDTPGFMANIKIFTPNGRLIRELVTNYMLGTQGSIKWDGSTNDGKKAPIGPYLIYIEYFNLAGTKKVQKLIVTLAYKK